MDAKEVIAFLGEDWDKVNQAIRDSLRSEIPLLNTTNENLLANGGKKLRPMLSLLIGRACGSMDNDSTVKFAAAAELLHNATLFHDDVADASSERRGSPTVAALMGGRASVLLGDYWLVKAMDLILASREYGVRAIHIFAKTLSDLARGEMLQLEKAIRCDTTEEDYYRIIYSKTASLFEASCVSAAISAGAPEALVEAARIYAVRLGTAFQVKDDIMDYSGDAGIGKPTGVDLQEQKITLPLLGALSSVSREEADAIRMKVRDIHLQAGACEEVRSFVFAHDGIGYAVRRLEELVSEAKAALSPFPQGRAKDILMGLADYTAYRKK